MPTRVILDTDIGTDVDDCLALAFLLSSPEIQLDAVTCVYGDVLLRGRMARKLLRLAGPGPGSGSGNVAGDHSSHLAPAASAAAGPGAGPFVGARSERIHGVIEGSWLEIHVASDLRSDRNMPSFLYEVLRFVQHTYLHRWRGNGIARLIALSIEARDPAIYPRRARDCESDSSSRRKPGWGYRASRRH